MTALLSLQLPYYLCETFHLLTATAVWCHTAAAFAVLMTLVRKERVRTITASTICMGSNPAHTTW